ncbi:MAG: MFS transporter [Bacteroidales bacterium]|nr:MFS transporter [Bacteroidales bacterium]
MATGVTKLSFKEKLGYSLGDGAANFFFQTIMMFQVTYFTEVLKLGNSRATTLFMVALIWNGIFDPFMGMIADKTKTRWGKFRPWILWSSVPFGVLFYLTFLTPNFESEGAKLVYAYATYILMMTIYSVNNTPYSALSGVLTGDTQERTSIASYRQVVAMACSFVIQGFLLTIKTSFAKGHSDAHGWRMAIGIFAVVAIVFHLIAFLSTKERITPAKEEESGFRDALKDLIRSRSWIIMFLSTFIVFWVLCLRGNMVYQYFDKYLIMDGTQDFLSKIGYNDNLEAPREKAFELFNMVGMAFTILGIVISKPLSIRIGKKYTYIIGLILAAGFNLLMYISPSSSPFLAIVINIFQSLSFGLTVPILWSMLGDVADFAVWKFKRRSTGVVFAGVSFALKMGLGVGLASATMIMNHFQIGDTETYKTVGFRLGATVFPGTLFLIAAILLFFYTITPDMENQIQNELEERRQAKA